MSPNGSHYWGGLVQQVFGQLSPSTANYGIFQGERASYDSFMQSSLFSKSMTKQNESDACVDDPESRELQSKQNSLLDKLELQQERIQSEEYEAEKIENQRRQLIKDIIAEKIRI